MPNKFAKSATFVSLTARDAFFTHCAGRVSNAPLAKAL